LYLIHHRAYAQYAGEMGRMSLKATYETFVRMGVSAFPSTQGRLWLRANKNPGLNRPTGQNMHQEARTLNGKKKENIKN